MPKILLSLLILGYFYQEYLININTIPLSHHWNLWSFWFQECIIRSHICNLSHGVLRVMTFSSCMESWPFCRLFMILGRWNKMCIMKMLINAGKLICCCHLLHSWDHSYPYPCFQVWQQQVRLSAALLLPFCLCLHSSSLLACELLFE